MSDPTVAVVVVAAGSGARLGRTKPKAFVALAGRTILERALDGVFGMASPAQVIVVAPASLVSEAERIARAAAGGVADHVTVVVGGASRQDSVAAGLAALAPAIETVLVHDSARALTRSAQFDAILAAVVSTGAGVIPGLAVTDTIKQADTTGAVIATVDRSSLVAVQTPQGFPRAALVEAYAAAAAEHTDDAALFAAAGRPVTVVPGDALAFKITTPWDLHRAEALLRSPLETDSVAEPVPVVEPAGTRTGVGIDVHAYDAGEPLWLGGLYWPDEVGLAGHSDGDAVSHAICDALLSAAGLGDIGTRFGTADPRFENAHGEVFIRETVALVTGAGFAIGNVAVQIVANHPKLAGRRMEVENHLGSLVGAPVSCAATTTDGLGFTGKGEGVAVVATALLYKRG
ncbi:MAG: 2-C-methyl-D-erythritol 4-phosphate cytidylyltransferase [Rhodoglobus sp.]|nr:2-C-methyl-D-erythritol 4-phosphate cytidylyltransferase [Rhodoglobus sp.]